MNVIFKDGTVGKCSPAQELQVLRHTAAHILAQAVKRLYPHAMFAYGPATEQGFYYDMDLGDTKLAEEDLLKIEAEMRKIIEESLPIRPFSLPRKEAEQLMRARGEIYKLEHIGDLPQDAPVSFFSQGEYLDMCVGPHLTNTKDLKAMKLLQQSGAYWRADQNNRMLTRISGTAFATAADLHEYLTVLEEAEKRDHRKIGREMELFMFSEEGPGFPFFLPGGMVIKNALIDYWRKIHRENGYQEIETPMIMNRHLWETSGHWAHYQKNMYTTQIDGEDYCVKPMNCPGGILVYRSKPRSYRELPMRIGELGLVHRHELRGALHGLFRVRCFTQDDAHIFMRRDQIADEIKNVMKLIDQVYRQFQFDYTVELSTRPADSMGSEEDWADATQGLICALEEQKIPYTIHEGDGAFYGPKMDFHLKDSLGRTWQCGTIQLDFQLPQNFDLTYIDSQGARRRPIMIHRVCFGSIERFIGILTEHYAGRFPLWLAPVQIKVMPVSQKHAAYAEEVYRALLSAGYRCVLDDRNEKIGYRIREARQRGRVPYMVIVGDREMQHQSVAVRARTTDQTAEMPLQEYLQRLKEEARF